jgi:hypothetical protein
MRTLFKGQTNTNNFLVGDLREVWNGNCVTVGALLSNINSEAACAAQCDSNLACQFVGYNVQYKTCQMKSFVPKTGQTVSYRKNPRALNDNPAIEGTVVLAGNTGIVAIAATLVPSVTGPLGRGKGKILLGARPEYQKTPVINSDNLLAPGVNPRANSGEIAALYDPSTETSIAIRINFNIFCHAQVIFLPSFLSFPSFYIHFSSSFLSRFWTQMATCSQPAAIPTPTMAF